MEHINVLFETLKNQAELNGESDKLYQSLLSLQELNEDERNKKNVITTVTNDFTMNNMIFYNKTSKIYFNYWENHYMLLNEDNMLHYVLEYISNFKEFRNIIDLPVKTSIKNSIMRTIKDNNIYDTIPDADTIQNILGVLVPTMFENKELSKIFLILLGNIVLKKQQQHEQKYIVFMRTQIKPFLSEINKHICMYFGNNNIYNYIKFKYTQDHCSNDIYKLLMPCKQICYDVLQFTEQFYVNLICVSIYYANRYDTIDNYMNSVIGDMTHVKNSVYYFEHHTKTSTIEQFMNDYIIQKPETFIEQKDILFLWKQYTQKNDLFIHIFTSYNDFLNQLFHHCGQSFDENNSNHLLHGFYSMEIPIIQSFRDFWDNHFYYCEDEHYFEISEILHLFHSHHKQKKINLSESTIFIILQLYYSQFPIVNGKSVHHVNCSLWDKKKEINLFIEKEKINIKDNVHSLYKKYCTTASHLKISKKYFTLYLDTLRSDLKKNNK